MLLSYYCYLLCFTTLCLAEDPYVYFDWTISYITASPLGIKQQVLFFLFLSIYWINFLFTTLLLIKLHLPNFNIIPLLAIGTGILQDLSLKCIL